MDPLVIQWHQLAWRPGRWAHPLWWKKLGLAEWQSQYHADSVLGRELDALLIARRGFPVSALAAELFTCQQQLLQVYPKLPRLMTALGIILLGCPDYLLVKSYRQALQPCLSSAELNQLWGLWSGGENFPTLTVETLLADLQQAAANAINDEWGRDPVWQAVKISLTPTVKLEENIQLGEATQWLFRLAKFL